MVIHCAITRKGMSTGRRRRLLGGIGGVGMMVLLETSLDIVRRQLLLGCDWVEIVHSLSVRPCRRAG
jgi:hypothetical protein